MWRDDDFAGRILAFRRQSQLSQQALAAFLGVGQRTVSRWERGVDQPSPALQERLSALIGGGEATQLPAIYEAVKAAPVPLALVDAEGRILVASPSHPASGQEQVAQARTGTGSRLPTILVVEDDHRVLQATRAVLGRWDFLSIGVVEGGEAVEVVRRGEITPDAAIIDFLLPGGLDGVDAALALREVIPNLPILIVTGEAVAENMRKIAASGLSVITKPVDPSQFHVALDTLLARAHVAAD